MERAEEGLAEALAAVLKPRGCAAVGNALDGLRRIPVAAGSSNVVSAEFFEASADFGRCGAGAVAGRGLGASPSRIDGVNSRRLIPTSNVHQHSDFYTPDIFFGRRCKGAVK